MKRDGERRKELQRAEYKEAEGKHGKPGGTEAEESGSRKAEGQHRGSRCEAETGRERKGRTEG